MPNYFKPNIILSLLVGEFVLSEWATVGLNAATAVKRGLYTVQMARPS